MGRKMKKKKRTRLIAWILTAGLFIQSIPVYAENQTGDTLGAVTESAAEVLTEESGLKDQQTEQEVFAGDPQEDITEDNSSVVYEDGKIKIYNLDQLRAIGTGAVLTDKDQEEGSFGTGEPVFADGGSVTYSLDGEYQLMDDIPLETESMWTLPDGFSGRFLGEPADASAPLYEEETDSIYIYHNYQLLTICSENAEEEPVMSRDMIPSEFGMGNLLYADKTSPSGQEEGQDYLTYGSSHHYILSRNFTEQMPEMQAALLMDDTVWLEGEDAGGRSVPGQVYTEIDGEKYILIGNESQLRAVGSGNHVTPRLYIYNPPGLLSGLFGDHPTYTPYYPGDADLGLEAVQEEGGTSHLEGFTYVSDKVDQKEYTYYKSHGKYELADVDLNDNSILNGILDLVGGLLGVVLAGKSEICGVDETGRPNKDEAGLTQLKQEYKNLIYSADANYIIFRDIDLSAEGVNSNEMDDEWTPLLLSGNMEGQKNMVDHAPVTISNIYYHLAEDEELDPTTTRGIGFFGSITNRTDETALGSSAGTTVVEDIHLQTVDIQIDSTKVADVDPSLVEALLGAVGSILGGVLGIVEDLVDALLGWAIPGLGDLKLGEMLQELLTLQGQKKDNFAAGSFAGRVIGDVKIQNCTAENVSIRSISGMTGGFVGYTEGTAKYDLLSDVGGLTVKLLANLLNVVPGLGLGDLITLLLDKDIPLGQLLPIGYYNPVISGCRVTLSGQTTGNPATEYHGGFVGVQIATKIENCQAQNVNQVQALKGAGGFAGIARDAVIDSLLSEAGVDLYTFDIQSGQTNCSVTGTAVVVTAEKEYAGGFNGAMTNSISKGCSITGLKKVSAAEYAGGFAGRATIGYGTTVAGENEIEGTLLGSLTQLIAEVAVPGREEELNTLLSLSGMTPSEIRGCSVSGDHFETSATGDYAGGLTGQGDGVRITAWENRKTEISGLSQVTAENYAGGIAGSAVTANPIGILNTAIGIGSYLPFEVSGVNLIGADLNVHADKKYASGGMGLILGGTIQEVSLEEIASVSAGNYAGGLAGRAGSGSLVKEGGLDLLGLGVVKVDNLLNLADGVQIGISNTSVAGIQQGMTVDASGKAELTDGESILSGGFISEAEGVQIENAEISGLRQVTAQKQEGKESYAGGFIGRSQTGGLAGIAQEGEDGSLTLPGILDVSSLLNLVPYLLPSYKNCQADFVTNGENPQVKGVYAGGFFGYMQSGQVENSESKPYGVSGLEKVSGEAYAGGFAGKADAGSTASSDGLKLLGGILDLNIGALLNVLEVYVPTLTWAGVESVPKGFTVSASDPDGSAGGYMGRGSGVQIKNSDVTSLKHTKVTPPSDSLESDEGSSYFGTDSSYAVTGGNYAGGYIGCADIGSAAKAGGGLGLLGDSIRLDDVLSALDVTATKIENSHVTGCAGGYSVLADGTDADGKVIGKAGGYAGESSGAQIKNSDAVNFAYIIGREEAGGFAGLLEPGDVASVLEDGSILNGLIDVNDSLASLVQSFIPIVEDCQASCIPCGGAVRADGQTDDDRIRGMAGGYVGYNHGGRILGQNRECAVIRLRSVYGGEFAGGFTGLMENASLAGTGNISLLFGLVKADNVLGLLQAVYPTQTNTTVYGPLRMLDLDTWNAWAQTVGAGGVYGSQFPAEPVDTEEELQALIEEYAYGYNVKAARTQPAGREYQAGTSGGYVGRMQGGVVTDAHALDVKDVTAYESAGGFAGEMFTGGAAEVGNVDLAGLDLTGSLGAVQTFVPVVRNSSVSGYQSGMFVKAWGRPEGTDGKVEKTGYAGGYVGHMIGGQIWGNYQPETAGDTTAAVSRCEVKNLRRVDGTNAVGGFAGRIDPGSAAALDTAGSSGLLGGLLQSVIGTPGDLLSVLNATLSTIRAADVKAWDPYGILINGVYQDENRNTAYAKAAGGFAGEINGAVIGEEGKEASGVQVENLRSVTAGEHAGGFFGLADVSAVAQLSEDGTTTILGALLELGSVDVLDAFRTYIYSSGVKGTENSGLEVTARRAKKTEFENKPVYTGNAGGFGGTLLNGTVLQSRVENLRTAEGVSYVGGFIGHLGKSGTVDVDSLGILDNLLGVGAGVLDVFGSHVEDSYVSGMPQDGFTVTSRSLEEDKSEIAGGFAGYADLAKLDNNQVTGLKQVASNETAGGFAGRTSFAYLADIDVNSPLVNGLFDVVAEVLQLLHLGELQQGDLIHVGLIVVKVDLLTDGNLVQLDVLGLKVKISLDKDTGDDYELVTVEIGDSKITLQCDGNGNILDEEEGKNEIGISLIKANRTRISGCTVTGVEQGYDVYGGGAWNNRNGQGALGYAGGFVGLNEEGLLKNNQMYLADVVRGTKGITGPFTGSSSLESNWDFNTLSKIEGEGNQYRIYRDLDETFGEIQKPGGQILQDEFTADGEAGWNIYTLTHLTAGKTEKFTDLEDAVMADGQGQTKELNAYLEEGAMAVLMDNAPTEPGKPGDEEMPPDAQDPCEDTVQLRIQKVWKNDSDKDRPEEIVLHITRSYQDKAGETVWDEDFLQEITLEKADYQSEHTWEKILSGQPYTAYYTDAGGEKYNYTYYVTEDSLPGYKTTVSYQGTYHYTMTITNTRYGLDSLLPGAGGSGTRWIYMIGALLLSLAAAMEYRKRKDQRKQNCYKE